MSEDRVKKLVLDVGGKEITLTVEQAKSLFQALDELFGEKIRYVDKWHYDYLPLPTKYPWRHHDIWCNTSGTAKASYLAKNETLCLAINK